MKKSIPILLAVLLCLCTQTFAQNRADELMKQAQENLAKKYGNAFFHYNRICFVCLKS